MYLLLCVFHFYVAKRGVSSPTMCPAQPPSPGKRTLCEVGREGKRRGRGAGEGKGRDGKASGMERRSLYAPLADATWEFLKGHARTSTGRCWTDPSGGTSSAFFCPLQGVLVCCLAKRCFVRFINDMILCFHLVSKVFCRSLPSRCN